MPNRVVVRYRTKPDQTDVNHELVAAVFAAFPKEIAARREPGHEPQAEPAERVGRYRRFVERFGAAG